ncbi:MAG: TadE family protein [Chloroflexota bacterium]
MQKKTKTNSCEKGQSLVEFAVSIVVLLILLAGAVDMGRAMFTYMAMRDAAQEGALYGSLNPTDTAGIRAHIRGASDQVNGLNLADGDIVVTHDGTPCTGESIHIQVTLQNFQITMPFLGTLIGRQSFPIRVTVTDTILRPACT